MAAGPVELIVDQGADFTAQIVWNDYTDNPIPVTLPMRMDVKSPYGQVMFSLFPPDPVPPDEVPAITYNTDNGLIQIHMTKEQTDLLEGGTFHYDLFATVDDGDVGTGDQLVALLYGPVTVRPRITQGI
jgi:hypothetical protein